MSLEYPSASIVERDGGVALRSALLHARRADGHARHRRPARLRTLAQQLPQDGVLVDDEERGALRPRHGEHTERERCGSRSEHFPSGVFHKDQGYSLPDLSAMTAQETPRTPAMTKPAMPSTGRSCQSGPAFAAMRIAEPTTIEATISAKARRLLA